MGIKLKVLGDTIKLSKAFTSGKDNIELNGDTVFEGKLAKDEAQEFAAGDRQYTFIVKATRGFGNISAVELQIVEGGTVVHQQLYNEAGKPIKDAAQAHVSVAVQLLGGLGAAIGVGLVLALSKEIDWLPGGAVGGALGGGIGGGLGGLIGSLFTKKETKD